MPPDTERLPAALADYLRVVDNELARQGVTVRTVRVSMPEPLRALAGTLELTADQAPVERGRGSLKAVWHEELGWWVDHAGEEVSEAVVTTVRHYLPGALVPSPARVAEFIARIALGHHVDEGAAVVHRYRLLDDTQALLGSLLDQTPTAPSLPHPRSQPAPAFLTASEPAPG